MATRWFQHVPDVGNSADKSVRGKKMMTNWKVRYISVRLEAPFIGQRYLSQPSSVERIS